MAALAADGVAAGALGFTTSRTMNHRTSRGEPTPTLTASADELVGIARGLGDLGRGVLQVVSDHIEPDDEFAIFRRMVAESGRPLSFSLVQSPFDPDGYRQVLERIDARPRRRPGHHRTGAAPAPSACSSGLQCTLHPFLNNPVFAEIADLPVAEQARVMADEGFKARVLEAAGGDKVRKLGGGLIRRFEAMYELGDPPDYEPDPSDSIAARGGASSAGRSSDFVYDLLVADERPDPALPAGAQLRRRHTSTPSARCSPTRTRCPGSATAVRTSARSATAASRRRCSPYWGRDRDHGQPRPAVPGPAATAGTPPARSGCSTEACSPPATAPTSTSSTSTTYAPVGPEVRYDLPAGGRRLVQRADGYLHTVVAGREVMRNGEPTGALPGRSGSWAAARTAVTR